MHPNSRFRAEPDALLARAAAIGFAHVFAATPDGPMVVHAPVTLHGDRLRFHVARGNRMTSHLDGAHVLISIAGPQGYVSPNWYERPGDQVPTWNYEAIEIEGIARAIDDDGLTEQVDRLAEVHEPRDRPWTRAKMNPAAFTGLLKAIRGFEIAPTAIRGTTKFSQNKSATDRAGVIAGLHGEGNTVLAAAMEPVGA